jgi:hypothetical protein
MTSFKQTKCLPVIAACIWPSTLVAVPAMAQQPSSATINGTIGSPAYGDHTWTLTLHGLSYSYHDPGDRYYLGFMTRVYATSFDFEFQGPHALELNANVSEPLVNSGLQDGPVVQMISFTYFDEDWDEYFRARDWFISITPSDFQQGLSFWSVVRAGIEVDVFPTNANGYPVLAPFTSPFAVTNLDDRRSLPDDGYSLPISYGIVSVTSVGFSLPGDFDIDRDVDGGDFLAWQRNPSVGDLADWQANFGTHPALAAATFAVPEPASLRLLALAIPALRRAEFGK